MKEHDATACTEKALQPGHFTLEQLQRMVLATSAGSGSTDSGAQSDLEDESTADTGTSSDACSDDMPDLHSDSPPEAAAADNRLGCCRTIRLNLNTRIPCGLNRRCPGYNSMAVKPRSTRLAIHRVLKLSLFCSGCQHAYCPGCKERHNCASAGRRPGRHTLQDLESLMVGDEEVDGHAANSAQAADSTDEASCSEDETSEQQDAQGAEVSGSLNAAGGAAGGAAQRLLRPETRLTCCSGPSCSGYTEHTVNPQAKRIALAVVVKSELFCTGCRHVLCSDCKAQHSSAACAAAAKQPGRYTLQQLHDVMVAAGSQADSVPVKQGTGDDDGQPVNRTNKRRRSSRCSITENKASGKGHFGRRPKAKRTEQHEQPGPRDEKQQVKLYDLGSDQLVFGPLPADCDPYCNTADEDAADGAGPVSLQPHGSNNSSLTVATAVLSTRGSALSVNLISNAGWLELQQQCSELNALDLASRPSLQDDKAAGLLGDDDDGDGADEQQMQGQQGHPPALRIRQLGYSTCFRGRRLPVLEIPQLGYSNFKGRHVPVLGMPHAMSEAELIAYLNNPRNSPESRKAVAVLLQAEGRGAAVGRARRAARSMGGRQLPSIDLAPAAAADASSQPASAAKRPLGNSGSTVAAASSGSDPAEADAAEDMRLSQLEAESAEAAAGALGHQAYPVAELMPLKGCVSEAELPPLQKGEVRALGQTLHPAVAVQYYREQRHFWRSYRSRRWSAGAAAGGLVHVQLHPPWTGHSTEGTTTQWCLRRKVDQLAVRKQLLNIINEWSGVRLGVVLGA
eukprot:gene1574-1914_t